MEVYKKRMLVNASRLDAHGRCTLQKTPGMAEAERDEKRIFSLAHVTCALSSCVRILACMSPRMMGFAAKAKSDSKLAILTGADLFRVAGAADSDSSTRPLAM